MTAPPDTFERVEHPARIEELLNNLLRPGGVALSLEGRDGDPLPVVLVSYERERSLLLDVTTLGDRIGKLRRGMGFRLVGQGDGGMVRTPVLKATRVHEEEGRQWLHCAYPARLEWQQRRDAFRAELRLGMQASVLVRDQESNLSALGDLRDLSLTGCRAELAASGLNADLEKDQRLDLEITFPDGSLFRIGARLRHLSADPARGTVGVGFEFDALDVAQERRLWFMVREAEREAARVAGGDRTHLAASSLFRAAAPAPLRAPVGSQFPSVPMVDRLAPCAAWLGNQMLALRQGEHIDPVQLSRQAERLLDLHEEDREALLFASRCLADEPLLVRHGLGVAVHLLDFARAQSMPHALCKALAAAAMVHDLGKALLPRELLALPVLDARQHRWLQGHVPMLLQRIDRCGWLSTPVVEAVVRDINERLDGSGYPNHRGGADLSELARLASVVDVVDILSRQRPGREPWSTEDIHAWLERNSARFDPQWVARYRAHFGRWPVGCLVRYADGLLGRVAALDERGLPSRVRLRAEDGGWLDGEALARHGEPEATVPAPAD
ncbi:HD domain-containing phosphohydrolase [Alloalcanivorax profundimaris]|uniref:HD domain-containing phosphohydrolase n=1 Tax=Alloalcanivorax profundimaris TaxID=2735259 RepID=UPI001886B95F|nr:HD domain-containing phosphohydrolase [Alloalcanivorax profundimaris]MBF1800823.1 phosphohydrolase [Alloalcanivorax profundimaris]MCQ6261727.1 PilZ domain-containing protein [Alcanivorax sp. MM125-6]